MHPVFPLLLISGCVNAAGLFCCGANPNVVSDPAVQPPVEVPHLEKYSPETSVIEAPTATEEPEIFRQSSTYAE